MTLERTTHLDDVAWLREIAKRRQPGYSLEQAFYVDPQVFEVDIERIYRRHWLLAGPTCRLRQSGDFFTYPITNDSVVVLRAETGEIRAFHKVCRHRGSRICRAEEGHAQRLVCPYHSWAYDLDGSLRSARHLPDAIDKRDLGLHPVAVRIVEGLIFLCLAEAPPDFAHTAADLAEFLKPHGLARTQICRRNVQTIRANWKVVAENFWECYHCAPTHPEFCTVMSYAHAQNNERLAAERLQFESAWEESTRRQGRKVGAVALSQRGLHQGRRVPIRPGFVTQSRDGRPLAPLLG
ncbi:MAG: Rieske 2Fe-2S domain-containing protein, partial [Planctomycetes bacterium]|nr:Rieske 2Fe-2S domain-containing protein [Planctomycetota bacterium]